MSDDGLARRLPANPDPAGRLTSAGWLLEGLRAGLFLSPRVLGRAPSPLQALLLAALVFALEIALLRLEVSGPARFDVQAWLAGWWTAALFIGLAWWALPQPSWAGKRGC